MITIQRAVSKEQITINQAKRLLATAQKVLEDAVSGKAEYGDFGICWILDSYSYSRIEPLPPMATIALVCRCATRWKHEAAKTPGSYTSYPISENRNFGKWEGPNLEARISLLRYVIKRLSAAIRRAEKNGKATIK